MVDPESDLDRILAERAGWTWFDDHLLHTCRVVDHLTGNRLDELPLVPTRARMNAGERCFAEGPAVVFFWRSAGDGTWFHNKIEAKGSASFVVAAHVANAMLNRSRQRRAASRVQPRWMAEQPGTVMVSDQRLYFANPTDSFSLPWSALDSIEMTAADVIHCVFFSDDGERHFMQLRTPWTALVFTVAALLHFPAHPLLVSGNWLPAGFEEKCHLAGKSCPSVRETS